MSAAFRRHPLWLRLLFSLLVLGGLAFSAGPAQAQNKPVAAKPAPGQAAAQAAPAEAPASDSIQKTISLLEDDARRREVIKLLKLMAVLEEETAANPTRAAGAEAASPGGGLDRRLGGLSVKVYQDFQAFGAGFRQTGKTIAEVFEALSQPQAVERWQPYLLKTYSWGLICLLAALFLLRKYSRPPAVEPDSRIGLRLQAAGKYLLATAGPNLALILSFLALPPLSTTAPGITVNMATGFIFLSALTRHFFINLSALHICLQTVKTLFACGPGGQGLANIHPLLARHFRHTLRTLAAYIAGAAFFRAVFLDSFVTGSLYYLALVMMTLPMSIYLSSRVLKLKLLLNAIAETEIAAGSPGEEQEPPADEDGEFPDGEASPEGRGDYPVDSLIRKYWPWLVLAGIWLPTLIALVNPASITGRLMSRCLGSLFLIGLGLTIIKLEREVLRRVIRRPLSSKRPWLRNLDNLANALVWGVSAIFMVGLWGAPLARVLRNETAREVSGRAFAILFILAALFLFLRFSRVATAWLLSRPDLSRHRNWRTMAPLLLTGVRTVAIFVAVVAVLDRLGVNVGPILAGAGIVGLGVGMGAQSLIKDLINGISILMMDTLSVGDYVTIGGKSGTVETVGLRTIRLRDSSGNLTVVPNSSVDTIVNMTRDYSQDLVEFTAPYDANPDAMLALAEEVARSLSEDRHWRRQLTAPVSVMGITAFNADGTTIVMKISTLAGSQWAVGRELRLRLKRRMLHDGYKSTWFGQNVVVFQGAPDDTEPPADPQETGGRTKDR